MVRSLSRLKAQGPLGAAILTGLLLYPLQAFSGELLTTIDLNYTYSQTHLGENITGETSVQQKYLVEYQSALTALFDWRLAATLDIADDFGGDKADSTNISPSIELEIVGPRARLRAAYDGSRSTTEKTREAAETESFSSSYLLELEVTPDYWPEARLKIERKREISKKEKVDEAIELSLRKEIGALQLEFEMNYGISDETLPTSQTKKDTSWTGRASYQETFWLDVDVDLAYEIKEDYSESFKRGVFVDESQTYEQEFRLRLRKDLDLTPRLQGQVEYEYAFKQDLLLIGFDYEVDQDISFDLDWKLLHWLDVAGQVARETEYKKGVPPDEVEEEVLDSISLEFDAAPVDWLSLAGKAGWEFDRAIAEDTGGSIDSNDKARYELAMNHRWGNWWRLTADVSSEYTYENDWLTEKRSQLKADLGLFFFDNLDIAPTYEIERTTSYEFNEPLALKQTRKENFNLAVSYAKDFGRFISFGFANDFGLTKTEEVDEVLNYTETIELSEDTKINLALTDFIRDMTLDGEIARKATDIENDEEPLLVDISYSLSWAWTINDFDLGATFKYDDNGDTFDASSFNTKVAWGRDNVVVQGEYQFDKTYSDEIDEDRKVNLSMNVEF